MVYVHVAGAVKHPSLYALASGSRVMQAIKAAGGPAPQGATWTPSTWPRRYGMGKRSMFLFTQPQAVMVDPSGNTIGHAGVIPAEETATNDNAPPSPPDTPPAPGRPRKTAKHGGSEGRQVDLAVPGAGQPQHGDAGQLQRLPGIGPGDGRADPRLSGAGARLRKDQTS